MAPGHHYKNVYTITRGMMRIPLVLMMQKFCYLYHIIIKIWEKTESNCLIPKSIPVGNNVDIYQGYIRLQIQGNTVGLHALSFVYYNKQYPVIGI